MDWLASLKYPQLDPEIIRLGPIAIRWYGFAYLLGFVLAYLWLRRMVRRGMLRLTADELNDIMSWIVVGVIVGGRLGWWLFYHSFFKPGSGAGQPWWEIIAIWHGGMSFHGGLIGVILVLTLWARRHKGRFWNLCDCVVLVAPVGLFFGRIANFINAELVGTGPTSVPWGVVFPDPKTSTPGHVVYESFARHPSQIYEALLEGPVLLALLWLTYRLLRPKEGRIGALFVILYGMIRFSVEFTRQPDSELSYLAWNWLTMGQVLSWVTMLGGLLMWCAASHCNQALPLSPAPAIHPSPRKDNNHSTKRNSR